MSQTSSLKKQALRLRGQSLVEVVVALGIVIMLAISLVTTTIYVQKSSRAARNTAQATKLVQQSIEQVRIFRDRVGSGFDDLPSSGCYKLNSLGEDPKNWSVSAINPCTAIPPGEAETVVFDNTTFYRWLRFASPSNSKKTVTVNVTWTDSGGLQTVSNSTYLSKPCSREIGGGANPCP